MIFDTPFGLGYREHRACFFARREIELAGHAERNTHPFARTRVLRGGGSRDSAAAAFELREEFEGPVAQRFEGGGLVHGERVIRLRESPAPSPRADRAKPV
jgi:hypothetical protein